MTVENSNQANGQAGIYKPTGDQRPQQQGESKRPDTAFVAINGLVETEGQFEARVVVPDENTVVATIKRGDKEGMPIVQLQFVLAKEGGGRHRIRLTYYLIEGGTPRQLWTIAEPYPREALEKVRSLLHTNKQGLPDDGKIAGIIREVITQMGSEAERRWREHKARIARELYERVLKEPGLRDNPLKYIRDAINLLHAGDDGPMTIAILAIASSRLPEEYRLNILFIAPSGRGKTNLLKLLRRITPKRWRLFAKLSLGSSPLALFYQALERRGFILDMRNKVWFTNEPSWLLLGQGEEDPGRRLMKQALSDTTDREPVCYDTVITINNTRKAVKLCLRGRPVIFATIQDKYSHLLDEQITSRMLPVPLDPSREVLGRIIHHIVYVKTDPATLREFRRRATLIRAFLARELPKVNEVIFTEGAKARIMKCGDLDNPSLCDGYIGQLLGALETESVITRATEALKALAASIALIRRRYEKRDGHVTLVVTGDDVDEAWNIARSIIESMAFGQSPLYQVVKKELLSILKDGPKRRKDIVEQIKAKYDVSERWVDDVLAGLAKLGIIERCKELSKGVYAISCPKPQDITRYTDNEGRSKGGGNES
jgi:hypothetical protein